MKLGTMPTGAMDPFLIDDVRGIGVTAEKLKRRFAAMADPIGLLKSVFEEYPHLQVVADEDGLGVTVTHFNTKVRFDCLLALTTDNGVVGRVISTLVHQLWGPHDKILLGAFAFNDRGTTDLPSDDRGQPTTLPNDADRIIGYFLHMAHRANANIHIAKLPDPAG